MKKITAKGPQLKLRLTVEGDVVGLVEGVNVGLDVEGLTLGEIVGGYWHEPTVAHASSHK